MENTTCEKKNLGFWKMFGMFMLGMVLGFMFAPIKKGIKICCDNKNSMNAGSADSNCFDDCFDCDEDNENAEWEDETEAYSF
mgnify:FL=1